MNREHKIFLGWGTVFKRDIHLKEQRKECWIGLGVEQIQYTNREYKNLFSMFVHVGGGGGGGTKTVNVPFLIPQRAHKVPFLIIQRALEVPFFVPGVNTMHGTRDRKHDIVTSRNVM